MAAYWRLWTLGHVYDSDSERVLGRDGLNLTIAELRTDYAQTWRDHRIASQAEREFAASVRSSTDYVLSLATRNENLIVPAWEEWTGRVHNVAELHSKLGMPRFGVAYKDWSESLRTCAEFLLQHDPRERTAFARVVDGARALATHYP